MIAFLDAVLNRFHFHFESTSNQFNFFICENLNLEFSFCDPKVNFFALFISWLKLQSLSISLCSCMSFKFLFKLFISLKLFFLIFLIHISACLLLKCFLFLLLLCISYLLLRSLTSLSFFKSMIFGLLQKFDNFFRHSIPVFSFFGYLD